MKRFGRWLTIKLLIHSIMRKEREDDHLKIYRVFPGLYLVGHAPGASVAAMGRYIFCLMNEIAQHKPGHTILRTPGNFFRSAGIIRALPGPGASWAWYLQVGR